MSDNIRGGALYLRGSLTVRSVPRLLVYAGPGACCATAVSPVIARPRYVARIMARWARRSGFTGPFSPTVR